MTISEYLLISVSLGLVASLNPFLIAIFIKKTVADFGIYKSSKKILLSSLIFISGFIFGGALLSKTLYFALNNMQPLNFYFIVILVSILAILFGSIKVISFFNKKPAYPTPEIIESYIHKISCKKNTYITTVLLGISSVLLLFSSYGLMLILLNAILIISNLTIMSGWSLMFVIASSFTIFGLTLAALHKLRVASLVKWNNDNKYSLRLYSGLLQIFLAWIVLVQISGIRIW